jgi:2-dehydro-3-deoxyphosphogluconate aldolase/(4S)-4-hydroxy-2-oxoglutarate aldolase
MDNSDKIIGAIREQAMLPLFYHDDRDTCVAVATTLYEAGVRVLEFTNRGDQALENFKALVQLRDSQFRDLLLAVGTIRNAEQANRFINAGADFLISPVFDADVCDAAYLQKILWIPGCMTPTEIHRAENAGCRLVKLFPGNVLGPGFVSGIKELFPSLHFMPTGGVDITEESIGNWFKAGVCAVGMGSKLISKELLEKRDYTNLDTATREALSMVSRHKK